MPSVPGRLSGVATRRARECAAYIYILCLLPRFYNTDCVAFDAFRLSMTTTLLRSPGCLLTTRASTKPTPITTATAPSTQRYEQRWQSAAAQIRHRRRRPHRHRRRRRQHRRRPLVGSRSSLRARVVTGAAVSLRTPSLSTLLPSPLCLYFSSSAPLSVVSHPPVLLSLLSQAITGTAYLLTPPLFPCHSICSKRRGVSSLTAPPMGKASRDITPSGFRQCWLIRPMPGSCCVFARGASTLQQM